MAKQIPLTRGVFTLINDADFEWLSSHKWQCDNKGYARRNEGKWPHQTKVFMHREIMSAPSGIEVDHIDGDPLNNQRSNLRLASRAENQQNRKPRIGGASVYKGVVWHKHKKRWQAQIRSGGRSIFLGLFANEIDAAHAYDAAARKYFGEFARPNFQQDVNHG